MDKHFFVELTNELYRLTLLFPQEEPLRLRIRELGDDILSDLITILEGSSEEKREASRRAEKNIDVLESLLVLAQEQKWVKEDEFAEVEDDYKEVKGKLQEFNKIQDAKKDDSKRKDSQKKKETRSQRKRPPQSQTVSVLNERQKQILELLEKRNKLQVQDVIDSLDQSVTKRTIRRDFNTLIEAGFALRHGEANETYYTLNDSG